MDGTRCLLFLRFGDVPADFESGWNEWLDTVHVPNRMTMPGFAGARRFRALSGESRYLTLYELAGVEALTSEPYLARRKQEATFGPASFEAKTPRLPGFARGVYSQITPRDGGYRIPAEARVLFAVGHDVPPQREDEFNAWYDTEHLPSMLERVPGFISGRRLKLEERSLSAASGAHTPGPKYLALYDLADEGVLDTDIFKKTTDTPWSRWVRSWYHRHFRILARRIGA